MSTIIPVDNFVLIKDVRIKGVVVRHAGEGMVVRHYLTREGGGIVETTYVADELIDAGPETAYKVQINEEQRQALLALLTANPELVVPTGPLAYWVSMLTRLRDQERESPGCLHGFCL